MEAKYKRIKVNGMFLEMQIVRVWQEHGFPDGEQCERRQAEKVGFLQVLSNWLISLVTDWFNKYLWSPYYVLDIMPSTKNKMRNKTDIVSVLMALVF